MEKEQRLQRRMSELSRVSRQREAIVFPGKGGATQTKDLYPRVAAKIGAPSWSQKSVFNRLDKPYQSSAVQETIQAPKAGVQVKNTSGTPLLTSSPPVKSWIRAVTCPKSLSLPTVSESLQELSDWDDQVAYCTFAYNATRHSSTKFSPH